MPSDITHGPGPSALDIVLRLTFFRDHAAQTKQEVETSLRALMPRLRDTKAPAKASLPWVKLATFGTVRTDKGSLRSDRNMVEVFGIEADYDGESITLDRARQVLASANLAAVLYTSPSHTEAAPRWRILCPLGSPIAPSERAAMLARLNGLFVGALSGESFTASQAYYYGRVEGNDAHRVIAVEGRALDEALELDTHAVGRPEKPKPAPMPVERRVLPRTAGDGTPYGLRALDDECASVTGAADGWKHHAINRAGYAIGGLVAAGELAEGPAFAALSNALDAIRHRCEDQRHAEKTLRTAFQDGMAQPRQAPPPRVVTHTVRYEYGPPPDMPEPPPIEEVPEWAASEPVPEVAEEEAARPKAEPAPFTATPFDPAELLNLPPRKWVYGHFLIERFVSVLGAPGGTGKTAYAIGVGVAVATGIDLLNEPVHQPGAVWLYNLEDPRDEILRRVQAALIAYEIPPEHLSGKLFLDSGRERPLVIAEKLSDGRVVAMPVVEQLIEEIKRRAVKLLIVDPFVKSHRLEENRNEQIDYAATLWGQVAEGAGCSILLVHHFRKGATPGEADAFRGASALVDASRAAVTLAVMPEADASKYGIDADRRRFFVRADNAKLNLAPPPDKATWLELRSIALPNGDNVQAVVPWELPSPWDGLPMGMVIDILDQLEAGRGDGQKWSPRKESRDGWAGRVIMEAAGKTDAQAADILKTWERNGLLKRGEYTDPKRRETRACYDVEATKIAEMRRDLHAAGGSDAE